MHHFRGRVFDGAVARLDPANVYVQFHGQHDGAVTYWNGYLVIAPDAPIVPGETFTLRLEDGRSGELRIERLDPDGDGSARVRAIFDGLGPMK